MKLRIHMCLCFAVVVGCRSQFPTQRVGHRFDELLRPPSPNAEVSTVDYAAMAFGGELRPVLSQPLILVEAAEVQVTKAEFVEFRAPDLDGVHVSRRTLAAAVRESEGSWQRRDARVNGSSASRSVAVLFRDADVGKTLEVRVTGWGPPARLQALSEPFVVPPEAILRFGTAVKAAASGPVKFRVSITVGEQPAEVVYHEDSEASGADSSAWHDVQVPLSAYGGRRARLRFESGIDVGGGAAGEGDASPKAAISEPVVLAPGPPSRDQHNVILVSIDTLRADHLDAYGYRRPISPTIDRLAAGGTLFEDVTAAWPETSASHMSLFTSVYPSVHGVHILTRGSRDLPPQYLTLAERLRKQGFVTAAITEDGSLLADVGFRRGFDRYREFPPRTTPGPRIRKHAIDGMPVAADATGEAKQVFGLAAEWLGQHQRDHFFLFLHTYQVHQRNAPGAQYTRLRESFVNDHVQPEISRPDHVLATYDAAIAYTDDQLGSLIRKLNELNLGQRTLLVLTSDHGEQFFEHGSIGHNQTLYEVELKVPLIFYDPSFVPAARRIASPAGLIDIVPTILDLLQLPAATQVQGRSWAHAIIGGDGERHGPLFGELGDGWRSVREDKFKLIQTRTRLEFFDLSRDPGEVHPLAIDGNPAAQEALRALREHELECQSIRDQVEAAGSQAEGPAVPLDEATRQRLRALGYDPPSAN